MSQLLTKLKLTDHFTTTLNIRKADFVERLQLITQEGGLGTFTNPFEVFMTWKGEFRGFVNYDGFTLRKRWRLFQSNTSLAIASGKFEERNGRLIFESTRQIC